MRVLFVLISLFLVGCTQEDREVEAEEVVAEPSLLERCIASNVKNMKFNLIDKWILYNEQKKTIPDFAESVANGEITAFEYVDYIDGLEKGFKNSLTTEERDVYEDVEEWESKFLLKIFYSDEEATEVIELIKTLSNDYINDYIPDKAEKICNRQGIY